MKLKKLISDDIESFLNKAVAHELTNTQIYLGIYSWLADNGINNGAEVYKKWAIEESTHAHKAMEYLDDKNAKIIIPALEKSKIEYKSIDEVLLATFDREVDTDDLYKLITTKCLREGDHTTATFVEWYLTEQIEEIRRSREIIDYSNLIGESPMRNYFIDQEFKKYL